MKAFFLKLISFFRTFISTICKKGSANVNIDVDNDGDTDIHIDIK